MSSYNKASQIGGVLRGYNEADEHWIASRLIFDTSLVVGVLGFIASLWGVPGLTQFAWSVAIGLGSGASCFAVLYVAKRLILKPSGTARLGKQEFLSSTQHSQPSTQSTPTRSINTLDSKSTSFESTLETDRIQISGYRPTRTPAFPKEWSIDLIKALDWKVFDNLCIAYWKANGFSVVDRSRGSVHGTHFLLSTLKQKSIKVGIVESRSAKSEPVVVAELEKLVKYRRDNDIPLCVLMCAGKVSNIVVSYCASNNIRLINATNLYQGLVALPHTQRNHLMRKLIRPDYMIPTCPNCKVKMVKRLHRESQRLYWGCISYPDCNFNMEYVAVH